VRKLHIQGLLNIINHKETEQTANKDSKVLRHYLRQSVRKKNKVGEQNKL
jgi:hypothetical protein